MSEVQPRSEVPQPTFEEVAAIVPTTRGNAFALGFRLESGAFNVANPQAVPGVREDDRIVTYLRTEDEIVRIEPDGLIKSLDLTTGKVTEHAYIDSGIAEKEKVFTAMQWINPLGPVDGAYLTNMVVENFQTRKPVLEVLVRTSRNAEGRNLPNPSDTPLRFAQRA